MNILSVRDWWSQIRAHPYADLTALVFFITLSVGGVSWWGRPTVMLTVDGSTRRLHPHAKTVGDVLSQEHIVLGPEDFSTPPPLDPLQRNNSVHVTRVTHRVENVFTAQNPKIKNRVQLKANLRPVVVERGYVQESTDTVRLTFFDGVKTSEEVLKHKTWRRPVFTLTLINPKSGRPERRYDLAKARQLTMRATGYYVGERYVPSDTTYLGFKLRRGLVAVDPTVIPLRSRLYVKGYGYAYAADTGSAIKGNRIDLAVKDKREEKKFNRIKMTVYVLEKAKTW